MSADPILFEIDKSGAEWVVVAHLANDPAMLRVVREGLSPHVVTGALISGVDESLVIADHKAVGDERDPNRVAAARADLDLSGASFVPRSMSIRQMGKSSNHGLNYDEGLATFALTNELSQIDARPIRDRYHEIYPGVRATFHESVRTQLARNRTLHNCFGRQVTFRGPVTPDMCRKGYAFIPQSTVFDVCREGIVRFWRDPELADFELLSHTHDSNLFQGPTEPEQLAFAIRRIAGYMRPALRYNDHEFFIESSCKVGRVWGAMREVPIGDELEENLKGALL